MKDSVVFGKAAIQCIADSSVTVVVSNLYIYDDGAKSLQYKFPVMCEMLLITRVMPSSTRKNLLISSCLDQANVSSPGSGQNLGHNSMGGDIARTIIFAILVGGSPEYSPKHLVQNEKSCDLLHLPQGQKSRKSRESDKSWLTLGKKGKLLGRGTFWTWISKGIVIIFLWIQYGRIKLADFALAKHIQGSSCPYTLKGSSLIGCTRGQELEYMLCKICFVLSCSFDAEEFHVIWPQMTLALLSDSLFLLVRDNPCSKGTYHALSLRWEPSLHPRSPPPQHLKWKDVPHHQYQVRLLHPGFHPHHVTGDVRIPFITSNLIQLPLQEGIANSFHKVLSSVLLMLPSYWEPEMFPRSQSGKLMLCGCANPTENDCSCKAV
nr:hypothetical protein Iba_chr02dCG8610 [Ipomoea batatas]